ncbi:MAG TPA: hypothetical protein VGY55_09475 [Pirellulales bacterium]|nr:hypothetical protein [Pirellulales bacterium]
MGIPDEEGGSGRWSLDHLFLDQDGIPTLVEVKRSNDTRIRREVVGQMLDYAANAVVYWPVEQIRAEFKTRCVSNGHSAEQVIQEFIRPDGDEEAFWQKTKTNLQAGRIRMIFVADIIPEELRRIVEFLNKQMDPAVVLAIEVRQFVGKGMRTLVPRLFGQTTEAEIKKPLGHHVWDEASFLKQLREKKGDRQVEIAQRILSWLRKNGGEARWGTGGKTATFTADFDHGGARTSPFAFYSWGSIVVNFGHLMSRPPFDADAIRDEFRNRLQRAHGLILKNITAYPEFPSEVLANEAGLSAFFDAMTWAVSEIKRAPRR